MSKNYLKKIRVDYDSSDDSDCSVDSDSETENYNKIEKLKNRLVLIRFENQLALLRKDIYEIVILLRKDIKVVSDNVESFHIGLIRIMMIFSVVTLIVKLLL